MQYKDFHVLVQSTRSAPLTEVGSVRGQTSEMALLRAKEVYLRREKCYRVCVMPRDQMLFTSDEDVAELEQRAAKEYRIPAFFSRRKGAASEEVDAHE